MSILTYSEYELLKQKIKEQVLGLEIMLGKSDDDLMAMTGFMLPDISEENITEALAALRENGQSQINELKRISEKLIQTIQ